MYHMTLLVTSQLVFLSLLPRCRVVLGHELLDQLDVVRFFSATSASLASTNTDRRRVIRCSFVVGAEQSRVPSRCARNPAGLLPGHRARAAARRVRRQWDSARRLVHVALWRSRLRRSNHTVSAAGVPSGRRPVLCVARATAPTARRLPSRSRARRRRMPRTDPVAIRQPPRPSDAAYSSMSASRCARSRHPAGT